MWLNESTESNIMSLDNTRKEKEKKIKKYENLSNFVENHINKSSWNNVISVSGAKITQKRENPNVMIMTNKKNENHIFHREKPTENKNIISLLRGFH